MLHKGKLFQYKTGMVDEKEWMFNNSNFSGKGDVAITSTWDRIELNLVSFA